MSSILKTLKLLGDATRLRILLLLFKESLSVAELQELLGMGQSRISTQLSLLKDAGLVSLRRSGKRNFYANEASEEIIAIVRKAGSEISEVSADAESLRSLLENRREMSREFFNDVASSFDTTYAPGRSWRSVAEAFLKVHNFPVVADLGAGEGAIALLLAQNAEQVIAVDSSPKMVDVGSAKALKHGISNVDFRLGEIEKVPVENYTADLAIFSQALHHADNPEQALQEAFRILKPGGQLIVIDLLEHDYEDAKTRFYDKWLGFKESYLENTCLEVGFSDISVSIVDQEPNPPHLETLLVTAKKF